MDSQSHIFQNRHDHQDYVLTTAGSSADQSLCGKYSTSIQSGCHQGSVDFVENLTMRQELSQIIPKEHYNHDGFAQSGHAVAPWTSEQEPHYSDSQYLTTSCRRWIYKRGDHWWLYDGNTFWPMALGPDWKLYVLTARNISKYFYADQANQHNTVIPTYWQDQSPSSIPLSGPQPASSQPHWALPPSSTAQSSPSHNITHLSQSPLAPDNCQLMSTGSSRVNDVIPFQSSFIERSSLANPLSWHDSRDHVSTLSSPQVPDRAWISSHQSRTNSINASPRQRKCNWNGCARQVQLDARLYSIKEHLHEHLPHANKKKKYRCSFGHCFSILSKGNMPRHYAQHLGMFFQCTACRRDFDRKDQIPRRHRTVKGGHVHCPGHSSQAFAKDSAGNRVYL